jgi:3-carboxy-cis,cis-muconate cycloisomerase
MSSGTSSLFAGIFARGGAAAAVSGEAWLAAMLEFEAALARACATAGLIPDSAAEAIAAVCRPERFDVGEIGRAAADTAQPVVPLVAAIRAQLDGESARHVHFGATSQDVLDTAAMLVARRATRPILGDAARAADALAALAESHARTSMMGRTLLQRGLPTTFGLVAAGWMHGLDQTRHALARTRAELPLELGGPAGDLSAFGDAAPAVLAAVAQALELEVAPLPWHANREPVVSLGSVLVALAGAAGKVGRDVALLAQGELGEVTERADPGRGGSSSMAHKANPVAAVSAVACAVRAPGLLVTLEGSMLGELQRAAGAWQAESETLSDLLRLTGSAVAWTAELVERLEVHPSRMRGHLGDADLEPGPAAELVRRALAAR